jgi:hypothetical protein
VICAALIRRFSPSPPAKRPDSLLHAAEHATRSQQLIDAEPRHRVLGADGLEARYGESDVIRMTSTNEVAQNLGGGKVDTAHPPLC